jgi:hypothetical protein
MSSTPAGPEQAPAQPDDVDRLEEVHRRVKEKQDAWRNLLESLDRLKKKTTENPAPETPSE